MITEVSYETLYIIGSLSEVAMTTKNCNILEVEDILKQIFLELNYPFPTSIWLLRSHGKEV